MGESFLRWTTNLTEEEIRDCAGLRCESGFYEGLRSTFERHQHRPLAAAALVDLKSFVPCKLTACADRAGMAHSLELRCPFLAPPLVRLGLSIPDAWKLKGRRMKPILADAFEPELPVLIKRQPKRPFNPPLRRLLRSRLPELDSNLRRPGSAIVDLLGEPFVSERLREFASGQRDHSTFLWGLLVLGQWLERSNSAALSRSAA